MRRTKRNVLKHLDKFLADMLLEVRDLRRELKKVKTRMDKVFPMRRGRPPKNLMLGLGLALGKGAGRRRSRKPNFVSRKAPERNSARKPASPRKRRRPAKTET